jgi:formamidopyrimidine-DNA glycosylase
MPELPELDVMCEILSDRAVGRSIGAVSVFHPGLLKTVSPSPSDLVGTSFRSISRRGKHLIFSAAEDLHAVVHLMLAGRLVFCQSNTKATKATACAFSLDEGEDLRIIENATTHRARLHIVRDPAEVPALARAGIEPLSPDFTVDYLEGHVLGRKRQIKKLLTDQTVIAGIGTAYADEILFDAKLSPIRYGPTLDPADIERLHGSIQSVLHWATDEIRKAAGGPTLTPHERPFARVFKKTGEPCVRCGTPIAEIRYAQTKTYYCPSCQSGGKAIRDRRSWLTR